MSRCGTSEIGVGYVPKDADDFKHVLQQLNRPNEGRWATGSYQGVAYDILFYASMFGAPNKWRLDPVASSSKIQNAGVQGGGRLRA